MTGYNWQLAETFAFIICSRYLRLTDDSSKVRFAQLLKTYSGNTACSRLLFSEIRVYLMYVLQFQ